MSYLTYHSTEADAFTKADFQPIAAFANLPSCKDDSIVSRFTDPTYTQPLIQQVEQALVMPPKPSFDVEKLARSHTNMSEFASDDFNPMQRTYLGDYVYSKIPSGKDYGHNLLQVLAIQDSYNNLGQFISIQHYINNREFYSDADILTFDSFTRRWMKHGNGPIIIRKDTFKNFNPRIPLKRSEDKLKQVQYDMMCFKHLLISDMMRCCRILSTGHTTSTCLIINGYGEIEQREIKNTDFTSFTIQIYHESWHSKCLEDKAVVPKKRGEQSEDEVVMKPFNVSIAGNDGFGDFTRYLWINRTISATTYRMEFDRDCRTVYDMLDGDHERKMFTTVDIVKRSSITVDKYNQNEQDISNEMKCAWNYIETATKLVTRIELFSIDYRNSGVDIIQGNPLYVYQYLTPGISRNPDFVPNPILVSNYACFIKNYICGGASSVASTMCAFTNVMSILKFALLTGEKPYQAVILMGERGSGKSNFCQWASAIFGRENTGTLSMNRLGQQFNSYLAKRLIIFDETNLSSKTADGRQSHTSRERCNAFKELITGLGHLIEPKGKEAYWMESSALVIACQDSDDVLPEASLHRRIVFAETYKMKVSEQTKSFQDTLLNLNDIYNLQNLVAYLCADEHQIRQWNFSLDAIHQIPFLPTIAEIRENLGRLSNPHADQGLGSEVDVRVAEHVAAGKLCFREGLMFVKDHSFRANQDPGCIFMHTEAFMRMWYLSMVESGCTPAQLATHFNEYIEVDGKTVRNPNIFTFDERKHKDLLKWMSMLSIQDENGNFVHTNLGKKTRIQEPRLRKWGLHEAIKCKGEFFFRFGLEWSQAFGRMLTKPPGQQYPKFIQGDFQITLLATDGTDRPLEVIDVPVVSFGGDEKKVKVRADERILNEIRAVEPKCVTSFVPSPFV